jgi:hypothetical protein
MKSDQALDTIPIVRDEVWLQKRLETLWGTYFANVERANTVLVRFGQKSRNRLGSIGMEGWSGVTKPGRAYTSRLKVDHGTSIITLTGYFIDPRVPDYVIDATIGHELVHYAHGFHSPHPQLYRHPHKGGIVDNEMMRRGMGDILLQQRKWLKTEWLQIIGPPQQRQRRPRVKRRITFKLPFLRAH